MLSHAIRWFGWERTIALALFCSAPLVSVTQFAYTTNGGGITITKYTGSESLVVIPSTINDLPVTSIGDLAFDYYSALTSVTIPDTVAYIGFCAFEGCSQLGSVVIPDSVTGVGRLCV
jgi:BspA type Leucine rich repeat region (6 copies)